MNQEQNTILITGGAGFLGSLLKNRLLQLGYKCVSIDLQEDNTTHPLLQNIKGDIRNTQLLRNIFSEHKFKAVLHCAAILAHDTKDKNFLWESNVKGTRNIAEMAKEYNVGKIVFISSNCLWAKNFGRPLTEEDKPEPIEVYGKSKLEGEKILLSYSEFNTVIIRCPTIIDAGRLGLLSILFEFIKAGKKVWVVGDGSNRYQFIYAEDLIEGIIKSISYPGTEIFNIGSDNVQTLRNVYGYVIEKATSKSRIASLPKKLTLAGMRLCHKLGISPLGPYHYKMIAEDFIFDTTKIKNKLNWQPTLTNGEMLYKAYDFFANEYKGGEQLSSHRKPAKMGIIRILKWIS